MKKNTQIIALLAVVALFTNGGVAYAQTSVGPQNVPPGGHPPFQGGGPSGMHGGPGGMGSSTGWMRNASSTGMMRQGFRGLPGIITEIDTDHFLMGSRGMGNATTTFTVNVTSATTYRNGSTTAAFSDLTVGSRVVVLGKVATSTNTVTADSVMFGIGMNGGRPGNHQGAPGEKGGIMNKIMNFFGLGSGTPATDTQMQDGTSSGPMANAGNGNFLGNLLHALLGWIH